MQIFKNQMEYLGHLVSWKGIFPMKQKVKSITDLAPTTNITEERTHSRYNSLLREILSHI